MSVVSMLKSRDLYEFIQGKYPQDEFTRFSDGTYRSSCPIHGGTNESSFAVFPDNSWYCFSCNAGGNIIDYLMEREGLTYSAAVHELCQEYSIDTLGITRELRWKDKGEHKGAYEDYRDLLEDM